MSHAFLSEDWFTAVEALRGEALVPPDMVMDLSINLVVVDAPGGDVEAHFVDGRVDRGLVEASTLVKVPYAVAKKLFIEADPALLMVAVLDGTITIEGDPTGLMSLQASAAAPSAEHIKFQRKVQALTA